MNDGDDHKKDGGDSVRIMPGLQKRSYLVGHKLVYEIEIRGETDPLVYLQALSLIKEQMDASLDAVHDAIRKGRPLPRKG